MKTALLMLEDGRSFSGRAWGAEGEAFGEIVFNTSMTGYQEVLTDPSYAGQIICMTYPMIGNYGVNKSDQESRRPWAEGFVVREASRTASSWRAEATLDQYLKQWGVVAIERIDTRALVRHIRSRGAMRACLSTVDTDTKSLLDRVLASPVMTNRELASGVTCAEKYEVNSQGPEKDAQYHVVCYDFGVKLNSLRELTRRGCRVSVLPSATSANDALALKPDGIFLSNGPGDPASMKAVVNEVRQLIESRKPVFGICLGHQLIAVALGGETYKLLFGHRGGNQPVKDLSTGSIEITAHNHGFAVRRESLPIETEVTHINLNDQTVAGLRHKTLPVFSLQYHPEAAPGPHDAAHHFQRFIDLMDGALAQST